MANPVFSRNQQFHGNAELSTSGLEEQYNAPSVTFDERLPMTYEGTLTRAVGFFLLAVGSAAAIGLFAPGLTMPLGLVSFVLMLVVAFQRSPHPGLLAATIATFGGLAGGLTVILESQYPGIALQAVAATASVFLGTLALYRFAGVRVSARATKVLMVAMVGYAIFSIVNFAMIWLGGMDGFGLRSQEIPGTSIPWGVPIGIFAVLLAAFLLVTDFQFIENGVEQRIPQKNEWIAAYGLVFTLVWLYVEFLRLLAILRGR